jgi:hypothetical protein
MVANKVVAGLLLLVLSSERFGAEHLVGEELCREPTTTQAGTGPSFVFLPQQQTSRTASAAVHTPTSAASTDSRSELRRDGNPATHQAFYIPRILGPRGVLHRLCRLGGGSGAAADLNRPRALFASSASLKAVNVFLRGKNAGGEHRLNF